MQKTMIAKIYLVKHISPFQTYNTDYQVPDSSGTATALFSGVKTKMSVVGVDNRIAFNVCDPDVVEKARVKGMLHWAQAAGKDTGKHLITHNGTGRLPRHQRAQAHISTPNSRQKIFM
jgi:alkaline phosphatase